jgi:class 3 adenylate cyclase
MAVCAICGTDLPRGARFCPNCGSAVAETPRGGRERKLVTVLFADVTGSTTLGERLDPERMREVMDSFFAAMRAEIEAEGGTVEKFIGDAVMAAFGVPYAHEDDPVRALRAALHMLQRLEVVNQDLARDHDVTLEVRIGVNTGEVLATTEPRPGESMVTGDAVNTASRLEAAAAPGQVIASERTVRAVRGFRVEDMGALDLKGKARRVHAFCVLDETTTLPERGGAGTSGTARRARRRDRPAREHLRTRRERGPPAPSGGRQRGAGQAPEHPRLVAVRVPRPADERAGGPGLQTDRAGGR